tara:strand:- start:1793 stop:3082 length:1290 start_codon:yes stop_codon:yes gene_type:complete
MSKRKTVGITIGILFSIGLIILIIFLVKNKGGTNGGGNTPSPIIPTPTPIGSVPVPTYSQSEGSDWDPDRTLYWGTGPGRGIQAWPGLEVSTMRCASTENGPRPIPGYSCVSPYIRMYKPGDNNYREWRQLMMGQSCLTYMYGYDNAPQGTEDFGLVYQIDMYGNSRTSGICLNRCNDGAATPNNNITGTGWAGYAFSFLSGGGLGIVYGEYNTYPNSVCSDLQIQEQCDCNVNCRWNKKGSGYCENSTDTHDNVPHWNRYPLWFTCGNYGDGINDNIPSCLVSCFGPGNCQNDTATLDAKMQLKNQGKCNPDNTVNKSLCCGGNKACVSNTELIQDGNVYLQFFEDYWQLATEDGQIIYVTTGPLLRSKPSAGTTINSCLNQDDGSVGEFTGCENQYEYQCGDTVAPQPSVCDPWMGQSPSPEWKPVN